VARAHGALRGLFDHLATLCAIGRLVAPHGYDFSAHDLHVDEECVCPRCLHWVSPDDIVRRTAYGPVQHETCPTGDLTPL